MQPQSTFDDNITLQPITVSSLDAGASQDSSLNEPILEIVDPEPRYAIPSLPFTPIIAIQLAFWSSIGFLVRIGLVKMHSYANSPVFAVIYPQIVGCLIMGWVDFNRAALSKLGSHWLVGLSTGLCGSITSFSSFALAAFQEFTTIQHPTPRNGAFNLFAGIAVVIVTLGMSISSLQLRRVGGIALIAISACCLYAAILVAAILGVGTLVSQNQMRSVAIGIALAPLGTFLRYALSRYNAVIAGFPIGTFAGSDFDVNALILWIYSKTNSNLPNIIQANIVGSCILYLCVLFRIEAAIIQPSAITCALLSALSDGFCGSLTTISTFALELLRMVDGGNDTAASGGRADGVKNAARYAGVSVIASI
eukprot:jgi/Hompol1/2897/HPOL_003068-RA